MVTSSGFGEAKIVSRRVFVRIMKEAFNKKVLDTFPSETLELTRFLGMIILTILESPKFYREISNHNDNLFCVYLTML
jgi:hypothetical protein